MQNAIRKQAAAGMVAASLAMAMAPVPEPTHFINDRGELMTVDAPSPTQKPIYVAIPLRAGDETAAAKPSPTATPPAKR